MKKSYLLIGLAVVVAIVAVYFIMFYPPVDSEDAAGRFGKVDKYREYSIGDGDIILRSDIFEDDVQAKKLISDLVEFADFTIYVKSIIDNWWLPVLKQYHSTVSINEAVSNLEEFSDFITNNNQTVFNTIVTIAELSTADELRITKDVESQLMQFHSFATQFLLRDSIFEQTISKIDQSFENERLQKAALDDLRSLRDRIVIDNLFYGFSVGDTSKIAYSMLQPLNNSNHLQVVYSQEGLSQMLNSSSVLQAGYTNQLQGVENIQSKEFIQSALGMYNTEQLQNYFLEANQSVYFSFSQEQIQSFWNQEKIVSAVNSKQFEGFALHSFMNSDVLGTGFTNQQLESIIFTDKTKLESAMSEFQLGLFLGTGFTLSFGLQGIVGF